MRNGSTEGLYVSQSSQWLIETKLLPPVLKNRQVIRQRLINQFEDIHRFCCGVIHAPAGYGKTTFARQLYLENRKTSVAAWLTLESDDKELSRFYTYLLAAVEKADVYPESRDALLSIISDKLSIEQMIGHFVSLTENCDKHLLLIIDDYHNAETEEINRFIQALVNHLTERFTLIISSRTYPQLALEKLRSRGALIDIDASALRFDGGEAKEVVLEDVAGSTLDELIHRTEGWPIAFGMINQMLANQWLDTYSLESISGRTSELAAYMTEQVLPALSEDEANFLMHTSLLNRFTGELADALSDDYSGWQVLETLANKELFLIPLDNEGRWYRYHQLFCEYLRDRMQRLASHKIEEVHRRAADWLFENRWIPEALEHALKGGDLNQAARMLDAVGGWRLIYEGKLDFVAAILDQLPKSVIQSYPRLVIADIWRFIKWGEMSYADRLINNLRLRTSHFSQWQGRPIEESLRLEISVLIRMAYEDYIDEPVTLSRMEMIKSLEETVDPRDHIVNALIQDALAYYSIDCGEFQSASQYLDQAERHYKRFNSFYGIVFLYFHRAKLCLHQAKASLAMSALDRAEQITREYLGADEGMLLRVSVFRAEVAYFVNDLSACSRYIDFIDRGFEDHDGWFDLYASAYQTVASLRCRQQGFNGCVEILERARVTSYKRKLPRLAQLADLMHANSLLLTAQLDQAKQFMIKTDLLNYLEPADENHISVYLPAIGKLVIARLWLLDGQYDDAIDLLSELSAHLEDKHFNEFLIRAWLLMGQCWFAQGHEEYASDMIGRAVNLAMHESIKAPFIEEGKTVLTLYSQVLNKSMEGVPNRYFNDFLGDVIQRIEVESRELNARTVFHDLTEKEVDVVRYLALGLSNKQIAERVFVSTDAVKYRLKKTFLKWHVQSRDELVKLAIDRGLVDVSPGQE